MIIITKSRSIDISVLLSLLERVYLRKAGRYGVPVVTSPRVWGISNGIYEELNKELRKQGLKPLSWEEFRELMKYFDRPEYCGIVYVSWGAPMKRTKHDVEPLTIAIYDKISR